MNGDTVAVSMLRLRKAALLAHWIPGVVVRVGQRGTPMLRVATRFGHPSRSSLMLELHPCAFRRLVIGFVDGSTTQALFDSATPVDLELFAPSGTAIETDDVVHAEVDERTGVVAFACAIGLATAEALRREHASGTLAAADRAAVQLDHDAELGVTLVHRTVSTHAPLEAPRALADMIELTSAFGAEEVAWQLTS